ncbi:MAG: type II toxin-antitoxin system RelE/ParE family toxin [Nitrospirae bacterium]|nr:type II toxin-antitoxin system RelE/ParE family toxin [Nitrospirota bacterium]
MAELIWSEKSLLDVENIYDYIARDSPLYARYQVESISASLERLCVFPESGRHLPEFPQLPHREVIVDNYRVIYRYDSSIDEVKIVAVVHGSRLLKETIFISRD